MNELDLFVAALAISDSAERAAYLERECQGNTALQERIKLLLDANAAAGNFLERPVGSPAASATSTGLSNGQPPQTEDHGDPTARIGAILAGKYKLLEEIGDGGMGSVYMAQQTEPVKRAVAVKVIKAGLDSKAVLARFEAERQALAMMDHPNIAKVLDAGTTEGGRPFFVMELVKGVPITQFCDEHKLTPRQRLELFVPVCQAIQHAHQKGVIHRDIKPSNVIVALYDDRPVPKVIDFGVAKAAGQTLTDKTLMTGFGAVVGTPEYMSPEQASMNNLDIDTRSDVYSLGVLLYELLTGTTPVDRKSLGKAAVLEILRIVREVEAPRPSAKLSTIDTLPSVAANRGTEPAKLSKLMKGELDWVVLKALEKDRTRRYETANGLARDIQRYLTDEVVEARPPSAGYRLKKFVRRHRPQVVAAGFVLLALIAGVAGTTAGLFRAEERRKEAERARVDEAKQRAEAERQLAVSRRGLGAGRAAVDQAFTRISEDRLLSVAGLQPLRRELLESARKFYAEFIEAWGDEPELRADLADATLRLAQVTAIVGTAPDAAALYRKVIDQCEQLRQDGKLRETAVWTLVGARTGLGVLLTGQRLDPAAARTEFEAALGEIATLPRTPDTEDYAANVRTNLAQAQLALGLTTEAERNIETTVATARDRVRTASDRPHPLHVLAGRLDTLGAARNARHQYAHAEALFREAADVERRAIALAPEVTDYQEWLGNHLFNRALLLEHRLGRPVDAVDARKEAAEVWERLLAANPSVVQYRQNFGQACADLGRAMRSVDPAAADAWFNRGRPVLEKLVKDDPSVGRNHSTLGATLDGLGEGFSRRGAYAEAAALLADAVRCGERAVTLNPHIPQYRRFLVTHLTNLTRVNLNQKDPAAALAAGRRAEAESAELRRDDSERAENEWLLLELQRLVAQALLATGQKDAAVGEATRLLDTAKRIYALTPDDRQAGEEVTGAFENLIDLQPSKSTEWRERQAAYWQAQSKAHPDDLAAAVAGAKARIQRGELAVAEQEWATALKWFEPARAELSARQNKHPTDATVSAQLGYVLKWVGDMHWMLKNSTEATNAWTAAVTIYQQRLKAAPDAPGLHTTIGGLLHNLGMADYQAGRKEEALARFTEAIAHQSRSFARSPDTSRQWLDNHLNLRATVLRDLRRWADAMADTTTRAKLWPDRPDVLLDLAGHAAECATAVGGARGDEWSATAVGWIAAALKHGAKKADVAADDRLAPFRNRTDFRDALALPPVATPPRDKK